MGRNTESLKRLADIAREPSPERRGDLVRYVADLFLVSPERYSQNEIDQFGEILCVGIKGVDAAERSALAERMALVPNAPRALMNALARDEIDVADPVLMQSDALTDDDLVAIVVSQPPSYARSVALREALTPTVTDALVATGDADVLESLAENTAADFSRGSMASLVAWAESLPAMQLPLLERDDLPLEFLGQMYFYASPVLRARVLELVASLSNDAFDAEVAAEHEAASDAPAALLARLEVPQLTQRELVRFLSRRQSDKFVLAFAHMTGFSLQTIQKLMGLGSPEALALACKGTGLDETTYCALMMLFTRGGEVDPQDVARKLELYKLLPRRLCARMARLWQTDTRRAEMRHVA